MADDEDAIYVDVIARLDSASADEVEEKLRDKLKDATSGLGDSLKDALGHTGDFLKDAFSRDHVAGAIKDVREALGSDLGKEIAGGLRETVEKMPWVASVGLLVPLSVMLSAATPLIPLKTRWRRSGRTISAVGSVASTLYWVAIPQSSMRPRNSLASSMT